MSDVGKWTCICIFLFLFFLLWTWSCVISSTSSILITHLQCFPIVGFVHLALRLIQFVSSVRSVVSCDCMMCVSHDNVYDVCVSRDNDVDPVVMWQCVWHVSDMTTMLIAGSSDNGYDVYVIWQQCQYLGHVTMCMTYMSYDNVSCWVMWQCVWRIWHDNDVNS